MASANLAIVNGDPLASLPEDLYIPPQALEVVLEQFAGPLDLLLYLIRKQKLVIEHLPVLKITQQYLVYIEAMQQLHFELAAEYLVMAALLTEIKSRALLPVSADELEEEEDPRQALIRRLQAYQLYQDAAAKLDCIPRLQRDVYPVYLAKPETLVETTEADELSLDDLQQALQSIIKRAGHFEHHQVRRENIPTRQRMQQILQQLSAHAFVPFSQLFRFDEGRLGVVVSFLALLELLKLQAVRCIQSQPLGEIQVQLRQGRGE